LRRISSASGGKVRDSNRNARIQASIRRSRRLAEYPSSIPPHLLLPLGEIVSGTCIPISASNSARCSPKPRRMAAEPERRGAKGHRGPYRFVCSLRRMLGTAEHPDRLHVFVVGQIGETEDRHAGNADGRPSRRRRRAACGAPRAPTFCADLAEHATKHSSFARAEAIMRERFFYASDTQTIRRNTSRSP
jgi:hypothetical protein